MTPAMASLDQILAQQEPRVARCYLLTIPPEILDSILKHLLLDLTGRHEYIQPSTSSVSRSARDLNIARTCKHLHLESSRIYFSDNKFKFWRLKYCKVPSLAEKHLPLQLIIHSERFPNGYQRISKTTRQTHVPSHRDEQ